MLQRIITFCFYLLFLITPLIFTPLNSELFEFNKMMFVYALTTIITGCTLIKMIRTRKWFIRKTPLDIPILIFFASQLLSTVFSVDKHTSIFGYYSRSNGGLLSIISYLLLYYALVSNFTKDYVSRFLKVALFGGLIVSLWAIPEHFGGSPSCLLITGAWTDSCWIQDVQSRVFATLGQPNWLAAYLGMLIFPAIYFAQTAKSKTSSILYSLYTIVYYLAFTFTYSRGATIGLVVGMVVFVISILMSFPRKRESIYRSVSAQAGIKSGMTALIVLFLSINLLFGSALTGDFRLLKKSPAPSRASLTNLTSNTQLENGGTESGKIRLIVWKGALDIFRHYPIFGSGVETFAYSYYQFRPVEHNLTTEWDFLYNKAHNEYLNYLATTGLVGFLSYSLLILSFVIWSFRRTMIHDSNPMILALLASYLSYLIQDVVQFSVVMIALLFYLFPALAFLNLEKPVFWPFPELKLPNAVRSILHSLISIFYRRSIYQHALVTVILILMLNTLLTLTRFWLADTHYALGLSKLDSGNPGAGYNQLIDAATLNPAEPLYRSELGYAAASVAVALERKDASLSASLKDRAIKETDSTFKISPANPGLWRTAVRTYYSLSVLDPSFNQKTLDILNHTIKLAPTDPKLYYNKALVLGQLKRDNDAVLALKKAVQLKPNYKDAHFALGTFYESLGKKDEAIQEYQTVLKIIPNDPEATAALQKLQK